MGLGPQPRRTQVGWRANLSVFHIAQSPPPTKLLLTLSTAIPGILDDYATLREHLAAACIMNITA